MVAVRTRDPHHDYGFNHRLLDLLGNIHGDPVITGLLAYLEEVMPEFATFCMLPPCGVPWLLLANLLTLPQY